MADYEILGTFFDNIWGTTKAFVYLPVKREGHWQPFMFEWPRQRKAIIEHPLRYSAQRADTYFAPALFHTPRPIKANVLGTHVLWADFDGNADEARAGLGDVPKPTLVVQSSLPGHEHWYWRLDEFLTDVDLLEDRNRALAYVLHADNSGWDADQVLRPVGTANYKRTTPEPVIIRDWE